MLEFLLKERLEAYQPDMLDAYQNKVNMKDTLETQKTFLTLYAKTEIIIILSLINAGGQS